MPKLKQLTRSSGMHPPFAFSVVAQLYDIGTHWKTFKKSMMNHQRPTYAITVQKNILKR